jgi:SAM-dependent methyltransferase
MSSIEEITGSARSSYEAFAAAYDDFTHTYQNDRWTGRLLDKAKSLGLAGDQLLDVGCGTGKSFLPMASRGWKVTACDVSESMMDIARFKSDDQVRLLIADMRALPVLGEFDLVWALDDVVNYLLTLDEMKAALRGMRDNLRENGVLVFDLNTLLTYRTFFCVEHIVERHGRRLIWRGEMSPDELRPGCVNRASFEAEGERFDRHVHLQRHFSESEVLNALDWANLHCLAVAGDSDGELSDEVDEAIHTKAIYFCRRA